MSNPTPPHFPTYDTHLSNERLEDIISCVYPEDKLIRIRQLESGKSWNNRIYFLDVGKQRSADQPEDVSRQLVMKLSGHNFGPCKIQNEVGFLTLLEKECPSLPIPRLIAWSEDGSHIHCTDGKQMSLTTEKHAELEHSHDMKSTPGRGWILTTKLPGRVVTTEDLDNPIGEYVIPELASHVREWREHMPQTSHIGNIVLESSGDNLGKEANEVFSDVPVKGMTCTLGSVFFGHRRSPAAFDSIYNYYTYLIEEHMQELTSRPVLQPLRDRIENLVRQFATQELYRLPCIQEPAQKRYKVTHIDFAPRNILVVEDDSGTTDGRLHISGILDWEFTGFFPWQEEYLNAQIRQAGDWEERHFTELLKELRRRGCDDIPPFDILVKGITIPQGCEDTEQVRFLELCILVDIIENIAPWRIDEGAMKKPELDTAIEKAVSTVVHGIGMLRESLA